MMFKYMLEGILLGLAYVAPIGLQNLYLINTAAWETMKRALQVALIVIFFDISLALACFFGVGILIDTFPVLKGVILLAGSLLVIYIGIMLIRSQPRISSNAQTEGKSLLKVAWICFAIAWLNPQALIDGSLLLGGFKASLPPAMSGSFITGVCVASTLWFLTLTVITSQFRTKINSTAMRWINIVCGSIIVFYGIKLGYSFLQMVW